jgi:hypothetical protein
MLRRALSHTSLAAASLCILLGACATLRSNYTVPASHPEKLEKGNPICSECHESQKGAIPYQRFDHRSGWGESHRQEASQAEKLCAMCHEQSFCNDCHVTRSELKPALKNQTDTYRALPHRGDYLSRHRIDARVDPTSCFRCHGSPKSSKTCAPCHG